MDRNERVKAHMLALGNSLESARLNYSMLLEELADDEEFVNGPGSGVGVDGIDVTDPDPSPLVASEDPVRCQHPGDHRMEVLGQELCNACGTNLS